MTVGSNKNWRSLALEAHDVAVVDSEGTANRIEWWELPTPARVEIERRLGAQVRSAVTQSGGFSHGMAARLLLNDGRRVFAKAINGEDALSGMYRAEAATATRLPETVPTPEVRFTTDIAGWFAMVFDDVEGRHPQFYRPAELTAVLATVEELAPTLTPSPVPDVPTIAADYGPKLNCWRHFAEHTPPADLPAWSLRNHDRLAELESSWLQPAAGETLLHTDLRPDNMLLRPDGAVSVIDWACPAAARPGSNSSRWRHLSPPAESPPTRSSPNIPSPVEPIRLRSMRSSARWSATGNTTADYPHRHAHRNFAPTKHSWHEYRNNG